MHLIVLAALALPLIVGPPPVLLLLALPLLLLPLTLALLHLLLLHLLLACLSLLSAQLFLESLDLALPLLMQLLLEGFPLGLIFKLCELLVQQFEMRAKVLDLVFLVAFDFNRVLLVNTNEVVGLATTCCVALSILPRHLWANVDAFTCAVTALLHPVIGAPLLTNFFWLERPGVLLTLT